MSNDKPTPIILVKRSRETTLYPVKFLIFENGAILALMKSRTVPARWSLFWKEADGATIGCSDHYSELILKIAYQELCERFAAAEKAKLEETIQKYTPDAPPEVAQAAAEAGLRWLRLGIADDEACDGLHARVEADKERIDRLPEEERRGVWEAEIRDEINKYQQMRAQDASYEDTENEF